MPGYLTKEQRIPIAGVDDLVVRSLLDHQQYADPAGAAASLGISSASWSLFGLVWPSGLQLADRLARRPVRAGERRSGTGGREEECRAAGDVARPRLAPRVTGTS